MGAISFWWGTKAQYDALATKSEDRLYVITDSAGLFKGGTLIGNSSGLTVIGTQTASTSAWTGAISVPALYDGLSICYCLPVSSTSTDVTLNLTYANGSTTGAKPVYWRGSSRVTTHFGQYSHIRLTYHTSWAGITGGGWWADYAYYNDTTYIAGTGISLSGTTLYNNGVRSVATGTNNGTINVNTGGTISAVAVKGLGSAAYTASSAYAAASHTHSYAGSDSAGGAATSAVALTTSAGSATQPIYFSSGKPVATSYTLGKSVPSNAVFTDTNTWRPLGTGASDACAGNDSRLSNSRPASDVYSWAKASSKPSYTASEVGAAASSHTHSYLPLSGGTVTGPLIANANIRMEGGYSFQVANTSGTYINSFYRTNGNIFIVGQGWANNSCSCYYDGYNISLRTGTAPTARVTISETGNISVPGSVGAINYAECSTASGTAAKTVSITGFVLTKGVRVTINFLNGNSHGSPTINVNGTGAKSIRIGTSYGDNSLAYISSNDIYDFIYDGTYWYMMTEYFY